ncbi:PAS domain S-box protein [Haloarculaceae archaeon H-GB2-1]|nr:PAS domain S-box protein [Haloarculaceae archaeon H-GB2-1]
MRTFDSALASVLCVADEPSRATELSDGLVGEDTDLDSTAETEYSAALERVRSDSVDCVVVTDRPAGVHYEQFLADAREGRPSLPVILLTETASDVSEALNAGVTDVVQSTPDDAHYRLLARRVEAACGPETGRFVDVDAEESDSVEQPASTAPPSESRAQKRDLQFSEQAIEQLGTGVAAYTESGTIVYANSHYAALLGTDRECLVGTPVWDVNPDLDADQFDEYWSSYMLGETRVHDTVHQRMDGGPSFPVQTVTTKIRIEETTYHVGTIRDITERKARERERRTFQQAIDHTGHAVMITDAEGTIEYVNPAFEAQSGYSSEEALGEDPSLLDSGEHDPSFFEDLWQTIKSGEVWENEVINRRKDGTRIFVDQTIAPILDAKGEVERFVAINTDITDLKEKEVELELQNERLENYGRTVAHDLRNPLMVIQSRLSHVIEQGADDGQHVENALEQVDRMKRLVDDLLEMAKHGQTVLQHDSVPLSQAVRTAWDGVVAPNASLEVADQATVLADEDRFVELLGNLFRNAVEHGSTSAPSPDQQGITSAPRPT